MYRLAFDPALPIVASQAFAVGERAFAPGDSIDWRALGVDEQTVLYWWRAFLVHHPIETARAADPMDALHAATEALAPELLSVEPPKAVAFRAPPGEHVTVETPAQREARRGGKRR
jgi:hypothetical protein